jgi:class 3 adenylate cyclase
MQAAHAVVLRAFLFTDIEGSLRLWERDSKAMVAALELHDAILRNAITGHGGAIFKTVGDAVHAEFPTPTGAVAASVEAQRQLASTTWTEAGLAQPLRVRMALHLGEVEERDGDFAGSVLNRLSRLLAAGH